MPESGTKSLRKPLRFWGWGYEDEDLHPDEHAMIETVTKMFVPEGLVEIEPPAVEDFELPPSRLSRIPEYLSDIISTTTYDRLVHSYGKSYAAMARMLMRQVKSRQKNKVNEAWTCADPYVQELREKGAKTRVEQICL